MSTRITTIACVAATFGLLAAAAVFARSADAREPSNSVSKLYAVAQDEKGESGGQTKWARPTTPSVKISPVEAMRAATSKLGGGTAFQANFEFDEGHWSYGVMVAKGHKISEVEVDPMSGKVLDSESVDPAGEASEMKADLAKIAKAGG